MSKGIKVIVASRRDPASMNIAENVIGILGLSKSEPAGGALEAYEGEGVLLLVYESELLETKPCLTGIDVICYASRHESSSKAPSLTVHTTGFWDRGELSVAAPSCMLETLRAMFKEAEKLGLEDWRVSYEATHHGPCVKEAAVFFAEIGSSEDEWRNARAGEAVAAAIAKGILAAPREAYLGIGGPHYAPKITAYAVKRGVPVGHIAPRYVLDHVSVETLVDAIKSVRGVGKGVIADWKGMRGSQRLLVKELASLGYDVIRV